MAESSSYKVISVPGPAPDLYEPMGSKQKFWYRVPGDSQPWLFKFPRAGTGEAWAEKVACEIAEVFGACHAHVDLAVFCGRQGTASRSFVERERGFDLVHGSEVLAGRLLGYDKLKTFRQNRHTLDNIFIAVSGIVTESVREAQLAKLAGFLVLDALIGNTDRHHDNWGLLAGPHPNGGYEYTVAPSFDHASSLGRELQDSRRVEILDKNNVGRYIAKARGGIYWDENDSQGLGLVELVRRASERYPGYVEPWFERVSKLNIATLGSIIARVPTDWMSAAARRFSLNLLAEAQKLLLERG